MCLDLGGVNHALLMSHGKESLSTITQGRGHQIQVVADKSACVRSRQFGFHQATALPSQRFDLRPKDGDWWGHIHFDVIRPEDRD